MSWGDQLLDLFRREAEASTNSEVREYSLTGPVVDTGPGQVQKLGDLVGCPHRLSDHTWTAGLFVSCVTWHSTLRITSGLLLDVKQ